MAKEENYKITKNLSEKRLRELCTFFKNRNLQELELKEGEMEITLKGISEVQEQMVEVPVRGIPSAELAVNTESPPPPDPAEEGKCVVASISGNFYSAPSPNDPPYVKVGDKIKKGDKVCIIEAMKVMNQIVSPHSGIVTAILAENGKPVKQGDPIISLK